MASEDLEAIRTALSQAYRQVGRTGYDMKKCFVGQRKGGNITIQYRCAAEGGRAIGSKIKALWGK
ncbi:MAG: hypothetical protein QW688_07295 [Thermoprotei archaeon]